MSKRSFLASASRLRNTLSRSAFNDEGTLTKEPHGNPTRCPGDHAVRR